MTRHKDWIGRRPDLNWDDVRVFLAVAELGSVRAAAERLDVSHSTVARRIDMFEGALATRLFERTSTGYSITPSGLQLHEFAAAMEAQALNIERFVAGEDRRLEGVVSVTMPLSVANHLLMADLAEFSRRYEAIDLELVISDAILNIARREADIAVRFVRVGQSPPEGLIGRKVATERYLEDHPLGDDINGARWLGWGEQTVAPEWRRNTPFPDMPARHRLNDPLLQQHAARHGTGIALIPCFLGDADPVLKRVAGYQPTPTFDVWLLTHPDLRDASRMVAARDFLADALLDKKSILAGVDVS